MSFLEPPVNLDADDDLYRGFGGDPSLQILDKLLARLDECSLDDQSRKWKAESIV